MRAHAWKPTETHPWKAGGFRRQCTGCGASVMSYSREVLDKGPDGWPPLTANSADCEEELARSVTES